MLTWYDPETLPNTCHTHLKNVCVSPFYCRTWNHTVFMLDAKVESINGKTNQWLKKISLQLDMIMLVVLFMLMCNNGDKATDIQVTVMSNIGCPPHLPLAYAEC